MTNFRIAHLARTFAALTLLLGMAMGFTSASQAQTETRTIAGQSTYFTPDADNFFLARCLIIMNITIVLGVIRFGHQYFDVLPNDFRFVITK